MTFDELPVGACFTYSPTARQATAKKTGANRALLMPGGRPTVVRTPNVPVRLMACRFDGFGQAPKPRFKKCTRKKCVKSRFGHGGPPDCPRGYVVRCKKFRPLRKRRGRR